MRFLQALAWLACVVYSTVPAFWLAVHPFASLWRGCRRSPFALLIPMWIALWIGVALFTFPWRHVRIYNTATTWFPAVALFVAGIWIYRRASTGFSWSQLGGLPEVRPSRDPYPLAASGIRAHVRHPIYLGHLLEMLAWSLGLGLVICFALTGMAVSREPG